MKVDIVMTAELGPVKVTELVGRLTEKVVLGAPETDTVEGAPAPDSNKLMLPVLVLKPVLWGAITTVPAAVSATKDPNPRAVAEVILSGLATVAVADTEKAGVVVVCAQPAAQAPAAANTTPACKNFRTLEATPASCPR